MKPVMLATDGSPTAEEATAKAIELAKQLETELVVTTVWDIPYSTLGYAAIPPNEEFAKVGEEQAHKVVADVVDQAKKAGVPVTAKILRGFPVEEICFAAEQFDPEFLVVGSHGWGPVRRLFFGSVSTGVLHQAKRPVLVVTSASPDGNAEEQETRAKAEV